MDYNKVGAISGLGCVAIAATTFAMQIWPVPQIRAAKGQAAWSIAGPRAIEAFLLAGFALSGFAIYGAWRKRTSAQDFRRLEEEIERLKAAPPPAIATVPILGSAKLPPVSVEFAPWEGQSEKMYLTVTNRGHEQMFEAQCRILARRNDPNPTPLRTFDLQWENGTKAFHLKSGQSGNLHIASAGKGPATNMEWMRLEAAPVGQHGQQGPDSCWTTPTKTSPEYDVEITIIGQQSTQPQSECFTVRAGKNRALVMFKSGRAAIAPETLVERAHKLRREIEDFVAGIGPKPKPEFGAKDSSLDVIKKGREAVEPWYNKITCGYARLYAERVRHVFLEYGEIGLLPIGYHSEIDQAQSVEEGIKQVIARLRTLEHSQTTQRPA